MRRRSTYFPSSVRLIRAAALDIPGTCPLSKIRLDPIAATLGTRPTEPGRPNQAERTRPNEPGRPNEIDRTTQTQPDRQNETDGTRARRSRRGPARGHAASPLR